MSKFTWSTLNCNLNILYDFCCILQQDRYTQGTGQTRDIKEIPHSIESSLPPVLTSYSHPNCHSGIKLMNESADVVGDSAVAFMHVLHDK